MGAMSESESEARKLTQVGIRRLRDTPPSRWGLDDNVRLGVLLDTAELLPRIINALGWCHGQAMGRNAERHLYNSAPLAEAEKVLELLNLAVKGSVK